MTRMFLWKPGLGCLQEVIFPALALPGKDLPAL